MAYYRGTLSLSFVMLLFYILHFNSKVSAHCSDLQNMLLSLNTLSQNSLYSIDKSQSYGTQLHEQPSVRVVGVVGQAGKGQRMLLQWVTSLSRNICLCSYIHISFLQSESNDNGSIPQPSESSSSASMVSYFRQCHSVIPVFYVWRTVFLVRLIAGNTEWSPLCNCL
jgi:hypothetical protein